MEYILFQIDEMNQQMVFCHYRDFSKGKDKSKKIQRAFPFNLLLDHEPKIGELVEGEIIGIFYQKRGETSVSEVQYLDYIEPLTNEENIKWIETFVRKCCVDEAYDELLKPPSVDEQVEDFIKEFFENEESESLDQKDFLADFFDEIAEEETSPKEVSKDVVANHFETTEEQPLEEKDFLSEFFAELESEEKDNLRS